MIIPHPWKRVPPGGGPGQWPPPASPPAGAHRLAHTRLTGASCRALIWFGLKSNFPDGGPGTGWSGGPACFSWLPAAASCQLSRNSSSSGPRPGCGLRFCLENAGCVAAHHRACTPQTQALLASCEAPAAPRGSKRRGPDCMYRGLGRMEASLEGTLAIWPSPTFALLGQGLRGVWAWARLQ